MGTSTQGKGGSGGGAPGFDEWWDSKDVSATAPIPKTGESTTSASQYSEPADPTKLGVGWGGAVKNIASIFTGEALETLVSGTYKEISDSVRGHEMRDFRGPSESEVGSLLGDENDDDTWGI